MSLDRFTRPQQTFLRRMFYKRFQTVSSRRPVSIQMAARRWEQMFSNKKVSFTVNGGRWIANGESTTHTFKVYSPTDDNAIGARALIRSKQPLN